IVPLLSAGDHDDLLYFTMPFIKGESLKTAIQKDGRMSVGEVLRVLNHVGEAIDYAHQAGIVHRDIKPANILRSGSYALITDFGVAKALNAAMPSSQGMTATGMAIGTPAYMAPEQLAGDASADHRIDIYAVGLLAYELLNGRSPFAGTTPQRMLAAVLTQEPQPLIEAQPDVPQALSDVVMRCLSKEPEQRPATARELVNSLDIFASLSGEIRAMEQRIPHIVHTPTPSTGTTPVVVRDDEFPALAPTLADEGPRAGEVPPVSTAPLSGEVETPGYEMPRKSRTGLYAGIVAVLAVIAIGGFWRSQRGGGAAPVVAADSALAVVADSTPLQVAADSVSDSSTTAVAPTVDSQAVRDSIRRAARRDSVRKARAKADSVPKVQQDPVVTAKRAAAAMLANASALESFSKGATHMGGLLNSKRKGDLQTQIDALQPFLAQAGLSYPQFKEIVRSAGVNIFDEYGRMIPDALRQFASRR
ncbi:MAG TPA: serine/threonine-protein kinase, partial [Gemmatimonadaceae bacterium]|nr:serine/threonine-protein kinase [Gemmatimonadaceae bacterium]